jgi:hypothetical protein
VEDFKINGKTAEINYTKKTVEKYMGKAPGVVKPYFVYSPGLEIATGEQVTFSCTIKAASNATFGMDLYLNWSPDGIQRYTWGYFLGNTPNLNITWPYQPPPDDTTTTMTTTATSSSSPPGTPGFTFLAPAVLVVLIVLKRRRRKRD